MSIPRSQFGAGESPLNFLTDTLLPEQKGKQQEESDEVEGVPCIIGSKVRVTLHTEPDGAKGTVGTITDIEGGLVMLVTEEPEGEVRLFPLSAFRVFLLEPGLLPTDEDDD